MSSAKITVRPLAALLIGKLIDRRTKQRRIRGKRRCSLRMQPPGVAVEEEGEPPELLLPPDSGKNSRLLSGMLMLVVGGWEVAVIAAVEKEDI